MVVTIDNRAALEETQYVYMYTVCFQANGGPFRIVQYRTEKTHTLIVSNMSHELCARMGGVARETMTNPATTTWHARVMCAHSCGERIRRVVSGKPGVHLFGV